MSNIYIAGETIPAGREIVVPDHGEKAFAIPPRSRGIIIGQAGETLREGFKVVVRDGEVYEDDA